MVYAAAARVEMVATSGTEAGAALAFTTALSRVDISVVASVFQATPLFITMGAALFLGEDVGWRRWSAILIGCICGPMALSLMKSWFKSWGR